MCATGSGRQATHREARRGVGVATWRPDGHAKVYCECRPGWFTTSAYRVNYFIASDHVPRDGWEHDGISAAAQRRSGVNVRLPGQPKPIQARLLFRVVRDEVMTIAQYRRRTPDLPSAHRRRFRYREPYVRRSTQQPSRWQDIYQADVAIAWLEGVIATCRGSPLAR